MLLTAFLGRVPDVQDLYDIFLHAISDDVRQMLMLEFARRFHRSRPAAIWDLSQREDPFAQGQEFAASAEVTTSVFSRW
jgi:hypothetical protein